MSRLWTIGSGGDWGNRRGYTSGDPLLGSIHLWSFGNKQAHSCELPTPPRREAGNPAFTGNLITFQRWQQIEIKTSYCTSESERDWPVSGWIVPSGLEERKRLPALPCCMP